jgi:hypothetical protein
MCFLMIKNRNHLSPGETGVFLKNFWASHMEKFFINDGTTNENIKPKRCKVTVVFCITKLMLIVILVQCVLAWDPHCCFSQPRHVIKSLQFFPVMFFHHSYNVITELQSYRLGRHLVNELSCGRVHLTSFVKLPDCHRVCHSIRWYEAKHHT